MFETDAMETRTPDEQRIEHLRRAMEAGIRWARELKVGDKYIGALPEANARYLTRIERQAFMIAALDEVLSVDTDMEGRILRVILRGS